jgi:chemotaxis protein CheD
VVEQVMGENASLRDYFLDPGFVYVPGEATRVCAVASSGIVVTVFDRIKGIGGAAHYVLPIRNGKAATTKYAAPAIVSLVGILVNSGSKSMNLEAHIVGGAANPEVEGFIVGLAEENVRVSHEILGKLGIQVAGTDLGGGRGRKIAFHTGTGELIVAKVDRIRTSDWYPR